jgi:hypothetical protein
MAAIASGGATMKEASIRTIAAARWFGSAAALLLGCGGGDPARADICWLQLSPAVNEVFAYAGAPGEFKVSAFSSRTINEPLQAAIVDTRGVISTDAQILQTGALAWEATLRTSPTQGARTCEGPRELRFCRDNPSTCAQPYPGSPWLAPYRVVIAPATNLTPLTPLPGAVAWSIYQGGPAHAGYVASTVNPQTWSFDAATSDPLGASANAVGFVERLSPAVYNGLTCTSSLMDAQPSCLGGATLDSGGIATPLMVVGDHAFVCIEGATHAVDLRTCTPVWKHAGRGEPTVSANGVLYVAQHSARMTAFNLL